MNKQEYEEAIRAHIKKHGSIVPVSGIFGDKIPNLAYIEEQGVDENGRWTKFIGCSFLHRGILDNEALNSSTTPKRVLMVTLELALKHKFLLIFLIPFYKRALKDFIYWFAQIYEADFILKTPKSVIEFSLFSREIIRVSSRFLKLEGEEIFSRDNEPHECKYTYKIRIKRVVWCIAGFFEVSPSYRYRIQDFILNVDKDALVSEPRRELRRLFDLSISREHQIAHKIETFKRVILLLMISKRFRNALVAYLLEFKVEITDNERYFYYRKYGYDFEGKSYEDRMRVVRDLDKVLGHYIVEGEG